MKVQYFHKITTDFITGINPPCDRREYIKLTDNYITASTRNQTL